MIQSALLTQKSKEMIKKLFKCVVLFLMCSVWPAEVESGYSEQAESFNEDLLFIQEMLLENHPGVHNALDPGFLKWLDESCNISKTKLTIADSDQDKAKVLQELGRSFQDTHLWIQYDCIRKKPPLSAEEVRSFSLEKLKEGIHWVCIPTFAPTEDQRENLRYIIQSLPLLREQTIIFDLRGNGGGNSSWGQELLKALFGEESIEHCLAESSRDSYVEWRASLGNLEHMKGLVLRMKSEFEENHPTILWAENICAGMEKSLSQNKRYYSELKTSENLCSLPNATNLMSGRVLAIIDSGCGSACLNFIDGLKSMKANLLLVGETTGADSLYMELRQVSLPSGKGKMGFPIKVYRNRPRGHNISYAPDIQYNDNLQDTAGVQAFVLKLLEEGLAQKIDAYLHECDFNGAVLVAKRGEIVISRGYGCANAELGVLNNPQTKFRIASLTKPFTAMAIMQLQEKNLLSVQDPLSKYVPDYPDGDKITIHHLLTHSSGVQNYYKRFADVCDSASIDELVTAFKHWPLDFEPGSQFQYSNSGYVLLAHIIETVSGKKYDHFLQENIFAPFGMNSSGQDISESVLDDRAIGYVKINDEFQRAPSIHSPITLVGNGDLYSSVQDLYKWDQALEAERILSKKSLRAIFTPHVLMEGSSVRGHGYGWFVDECRGKRVVEYSGALRGFLSKYVKFVDDQVTIIILTNVEVEDQDRFFKIYEGLAEICCSFRAR